LNFLIDENMPRSLVALIAVMGFSVQDVRDIGLRGQPDSEVFNAAIAADAIIITRDRGFTRERKRLPASLLGAVTIVELRRALSRIVRRRP
jgi:predicted nuclease of predicted toxin-antitoxin system